MAIDIKALNTRKKELLDAQEKMLVAATDSKIQLTAAQEEQFKNFTNEIDSINTNLARTEAINKGKLEVGVPSSTLAIPADFSNVKSKYTNCTAEYAGAFWNALSTRNFSNAALGEGGTAADGSFLVPNQTDPSIPNLAVIEASARKLSRVITTEMDVKLPYQASKTVAALKAESNNTSTNAFATNVPTFNTTTLTAYMAGDSVAVSWELMQDVKALSQFITADLNRAVYNYEEGMFINGTGTGQPLGYVTGATQFATEALSINNILDLIASIKAAYFSGSSFLMNRSEFHRLYKAQIASSQFQTYVTYDVNGQPRILGFPVYFSSVMPTYLASPATTGAVLFGDFSAGWVIGDRGDANIRVKVLDQVAALNGQTIVLGYRRTDQRCVLQEAVACLTTNA
jgi:HK97 family phage major capsid protein